MEKEPATTPDAMMRIGQSAEAAGDTLTAINIYDRARQKDPNDPEPLNAMGRVLLTTGQVQRAAAVYEELRNRHRGFIPAYVGLGVAYDLQGRHHQAQQVYNDGLAQAPDNAALRNNMALSLALAGDSQAAVMVLSEIAGGPQSTARSRQNLALIYGLAGRTEEAAHWARADLSEAEVQGNLKLYRKLRTMVGTPELRRVLLQGRPVPAMEPLRSPTR